GTMTINDAYSLPTADGTADQFMQTDGSGNLSWGAPVIPVLPLAGNGLTDNSGTFELGGTLSSGTTISSGGNDLTYNFTGGSKMTVQHNGSRLLEVGETDMSVNVFAGFFIVDSTLNIEVEFGPFGVNGGVLVLRDDGTAKTTLNGASGSSFLQNVGIHKSNPGVALDVVGDIHYTGDILDVSDRRLKENIRPLEGALEKLAHINGYSYNMKDDGTKTREFGVIAQEVRKVFPHMVRNVDETTDHLSVCYIQLIPVLLEGIKEQQELIDDQGQEIAHLKASLAEMEDLKAQVVALQELVMTQVAGSDGSDE
ncbi:MAG: tail fiber domain-containing protein, partial [Saprospiraceae bacterium]|nr:tail fiber domain-containing protein [Saprospiraceae bacterium]